MKKAKKLKKHRITDKTMVRNLKEYISDCKRETEKIRTLLGLNEKGIDSLFDDIFVIGKEIKALIKREGE